MAMSNDFNSREYMKFKQVGTGSTSAIIIIPADTVLTQAIENNSNGQPVYIGEAVPGTAKSETGWRIKKITYSGTTITDVMWASGTDNFDKIWNSRASYSYS